MTICPKCGKEYRMTPDICEACGTPLTDPDFQDPFAEAVREEAALREAARQRREARLAPKLPPAETELFPEREADAFDGTEEPEPEAPAMSRRTALRILAVASAFAVAAGGWYGWKYLQRKWSAAKTDLVYFDGSQPYFYDGQTGKTHPLGQPIKLLETMSAGSDQNSICKDFCSRTVLSRDRSRIFYPQYHMDAADGQAYYNYKTSQDDYGTDDVHYEMYDGQPESAEAEDGSISDIREFITPCCLNLTKKEPAEQKLWPLTNYYSETYGSSGESQSVQPSVSSYSLLDSRGEYVLLTMKQGEFAVWKDPAVFGMSSAMEPFSAQMVIPTETDGAFLCFTEPEKNAGQEEPVFLNDDIGLDTLYDLDLVNVRDSSRTRIASAVLYFAYGGYMEEIVEPRYMEEIVEPRSRYLFYATPYTTDHAEIPEEGMTLRQGQYKVRVTGGSIPEFHAIYAPETLSQSGAEQKGREMLSSGGEFLYGTAVHRFDLQTCTDRFVYGDDRRIELSWYGEQNGGLIRGERTSAEDETEYDLTFYGPELELDESLEMHLKDGMQFQPAGGASGVYYFGVSPWEAEDYEGKHDLIVQGRRIELLDFPSGYIRSITVSPDLRNVLIRMDNGLDGQGAGYIGKITDADTITMEPVATNGGRAAFLGNELLWFSEEEGRVTAESGGYMITENADNQFQRLYTDAKTGALYFTEYETAGGDVNSSYRVLCRWEVGAENCTLTRIADKVVAESFLFEKETGRFSFVRYEDAGEKKYAIYSGDGNAKSLKDCTRIGDGFATLPIMQKPRNQMPDSRYAFSYALD